MTDANAADHRTPKLQLAIETTGRCGSIAILRGQEVLQATNLPETTRTAASLAVYLDDILSRHRDGSQPIELVSVADGPGSFTGLRIGVTTAKSLCYALKVPLVAVDSLAAVATAIFHDNIEAQSVCVGLDAYRQQVFAGCFRRTELLGSPDRLPPNWTPHPPQVKVLSASQWNAFLSGLGQSNAPSDRSPDRFGSMSGFDSANQSVSPIGESPLRSSPNSFPGSLNQPNSLNQPSSLNHGSVGEQWFAAGDEKPFQQSRLTMLSRKCDAIGVGFLAARAYRLGLSTDPLALIPRYLKPSAAEEKAQQDQG